MFLDLTRPSVINSTAAIWIAVGVVLITGIVIALIARRQNAKKK